MKYSVSISLFLASLSIGAQEINTIKVKTEISEAIVYLDGAEVTRVKKLNLAKGKSLLVFENLSPKINNKTVQLNVPKGIDILSITSRINYLSEDQGRPDVKKIRDSVEIMNFKVRSLNDERSAYLLEKDLLVSNKSIGGQQNGVSIADLKTAADFFRLRLKEINTQVASIDQKVNGYNAILKKLNQQLAEANNKNYVQRGEVSVLIASEAAVTAFLELKYLVSEVGWIPAYDIRATEISEPIQLVYRAKVYNNSDVDWNNVKLTLSSADPTSSASKPVFEPWYLSYKTTSSPANAYSQGIPASRPEADKSLQSFDLEARSMTNLPTSSEGTFQRGALTFTNIAITDVSAEFVIKDEYSIPSDAKPYFIEIKEYKLQATYKHFSIPKQNCDVFLLARITGWENLDILEGTANIYLNGTFTGQSFINTRDVNDTLDLSLGRDNKVQINRRKLTEFNNSRLIGSNIKESFGYEIVVKNNHPVPIVIEIIDQLPVPQDSDIEVDNLELSNGEHNELNGEVKWKNSLKPAESKTIKLSFAIKYPKGRPIDTRTRKYRSVRWM